MLDLLSSPEIWASFLTLAALEIVLGIDNVIFLSIASGKLPKEQQAKARRIGLFLALAMRIGLLLSITWVASLTQPAFTLFGFEASWRDLVLGLGGLFLLYKGTVEVHSMMEGRHDEHAAAKASFASVITQIVILDLVFSLDSVITAVGMTDQVEVMIAAVVVAILVMLFAAETIAGFVNRHPTVKMLALNFLLLIGVALIADGLHFHIPREYIYFAIAFSAAVEAMNLLAARARNKRRTAEGKPGGH